MFSDVGESLLVDMPWVPVGDSPFVALVENFGWRTAMELKGLEAESPTQARQLGGAVVGIEVSLNESGSAYGQFHFEEVPDERK